MSTVNYCSDCGIGSNLSDGLKISIFIIEIKIYVFILQNKQMFRIILLNLLKTFIP
jgi:hypothetical protein